MIFSHCIIYESVPNNPTIHWIFWLFGICQSPVPVQIGPYFFPLGCTDDCLISGPHPIISFHHIHLTSHFCQPHLLISLTSPPWCLHSMSFIICVPTWPDHLCTHLTWSSVYPPDLIISVSTWPDLLWSSHNTCTISLQHHHPHDEDAVWCNRCDVTFHYMNHFQCYIVHPLIKVCTQYLTS